MRPRVVIRPDVGRMIPATVFSSVVLPEPFAPISPAVSEVSISTARRP